MRIELRQALISYHDYHTLSRTGQAVPHEVLASGRECGISNWQGAMEAVRQALNRLLCACLLHLLNAL